MGGHEERMIPRRVILIGFYIVLISAIRVLLGMTKGVATKLPPTSASPAEAILMNDMMMTISQNDSSPTTVLLTEENESYTGTARNETNKVTCGCPSSCNAHALARQFGTLPYSCGERIKLIMTKNSTFQSDACTLAVRGQACGAECDPERCLNTNSTLSPSFSHDEMVIRSDVDDANKMVDDGQEVKTNYTEPTMPPSNDTLIVGERIRSDVSGTNTTTTTAATSALSQSVERPTQTTSEPQVPTRIRRSDVNRINTTTTTTTVPALQNTSPKRSEPKVAPKIQSGVTHTNITAQTLQNASPRIIMSELKVAPKIQSDVNRTNATPPALQNISPHVNSTNTTSSVSRQKPVVKPSFPIFVARYVQQMLPLLLLLLFRFVF